ncbi:MAG: DUF2946 domain-containing protein [Burkholderiaceae bacterium]|nr:DUF2946 domain-containing protein [Burkholderiaceae bacterium]
MSTFPFSPRLRQAMAWLALCAMCFGAAAPTVSRWLVQAGQRQDLIEICNGHGITLLTAAQLAALQEQPQDSQAGDERGSRLAGDSSGDGDVCPYCTLIHHTPFMPTVAAAFAPHVPPQVAHRVGAQVAAPALRHWRRPQMPQAPPAFA